MKKKIRYLLYILISLLLSIFILTLSENQTNWHYFWRLIKVPSMWPAFADIDHIFQSINCKLSGIDPFIYNPCDYNNIRYQYPVLWLILFEYLNLNIYKNFQFFLFLSLSLLFIVYSLLLELSKKILSKVILLVLFFSTTSTLLIERGNVDHILFVLTFSVILFSSYYYKIIVISFASLLKIYPFYSFFYLIRKQNKLLLLLIVMMVVAYLLYEVSLSKYIYKNHSIMAMSQTFGIQSITEGFFKIFEKTNFLYLSENSKNLIRIISSITFLGICFLVFYIGSKLADNFFLKSSISNKEQESLFILGSTIYIGCFIFYSNIDYRLIFLYLTIPYFEKFNKKIFFTYSFSLIIICNSFLIGFAPLTLNHFIYTFVLYLIKISIAIFLSLILGNISKNLFDKKKYDYF
jgi:hypothetical protein